MYMYVCMLYAKTEMHIQKLHKHAREFHDQLHAKQYFHLILCHLMNLQKNRIQMSGLSGSRGLLTEMREHEDVEKLTDKGDARKFYGKLRRLAAGFKIRRISYWPIEVI